MLELQRTADALRGCLESLPSVAGTRQVFGGIQQHLLNHCPTVLSHVLCPRLHYRLLTLCPAAY